MVHPNFPLLCIIICLVSKLLSSVCRNIVPQWRHYDFGEPPFYASLITQLTWLPQSLTRHAPLNPYIPCLFTWSNLGRLFKIIDRAFQFVVSLVVYKWCWSRSFIKNGVQVVKANNGQVMGQFWNKSKAIVSISEFLEVTFFLVHLLSFFFFQPSRDAAILILWGRKPGYCISRHLYPLYLLRILYLQDQRVFMPKKWFLINWFHCFIWNLIQSSLCFFFFQRKE